LDEAIPQGFLLWFLLPVNPVDILRGYVDMAQQVLVGHPEVAVGMIWRYASLITPV
jgi:hypothetical protein